LFRKLLNGKLILKLKQTPMPCLTKVQGIKICVYSNDHDPQHIHAIFGKYEVIIAIREIEVINGICLTTKNALP
jgi:hypothetical protein